MDTVAGSLLGRGDEIVAEQVPDVVSQLLEEARDHDASDLHFLPTETAIEISWRIDGVLQLKGTLPRRLAANIVARLKVLAELLTYRTDIPQEGRIRSGDESLEMRVSTFPTLFGEKAVVRLLIGPGRFGRVADLGLPDDVTATLGQLLRCRSGVILVTGPAGSGKTTTLYTCLRELAAIAESPLSMVSLEDPVESVVAGVAQSQVNPAAGFDYATGLRSLMRQDPEVIMVGEIRDRETAKTVLQASLTGHLVLTTFHAGSAAEAIGRLAEMGLEPHLLRSGLLAIICQRLLRRLCSSACSGTAGCKACRGSGYDGRGLVAELFDLSPTAVSTAILESRDATQLQAAAVNAGMIDLSRRAADAVESGWTSAEEVIRVLGLPGGPNEPGDAS